jgi:hypothetical protein
MGQNDRDNSKKIRSILAAATAAVALSALPALAQHATGQASAGHVGVSGPVTSAHSAGAPVRSGPIPPNSFGASSAPPRPGAVQKTVTPHWEIPSSIHVHPNSVLGNGILRNRVGFGVGFLGFPYYAGPSAFAGAGTDDDAAQQPQPNAPAGPADGPQEPYAEGSPGASYAEGSPGAYGDAGYPAPPRAPYNPEAYPQQQQNNAAAPGDGLGSPALTLVFNDGRPPMQVHSYVLTESSVFVAENGHQRVIPIADLDLPATIAQNRDAGVDFQLPGGAGGSR